MSRQPISVKRILLALIAVFAATSLVSLAFMSLMGIPSALLWHIQRGNTIAVEGHTFRIPLLLAPESGTKPGDITLLATHPIRGGLEAISISKTGKPSSEAGNIARIQKLIALFSRVPHPLHYTIERIEGQRLIFTCLREDPDGNFENLRCYAADSDISVFTMASGRYRHEMRDLLTTSH
jgi:hypothetical protein